MKKRVILYAIVFISIWSPLQAIEESIRPGEPIDKLIKEKGEVQLRRCGVKCIEDKGMRKIIGLYKITIGNPQKIRQALMMNMICGFDGWIFAPKTENKKYWHKIRIHNAQGSSKGQKHEEVIPKDQLPMPYNMMPAKLIEKIEFFNVYPENDHVIVVYIVERTELADCEAIFDYLYHKSTT